MTGPFLDRQIPAQRTHYKVTLAVLTLGAIAYALLQSLVLPALPTIQHSLDVSQTTVTWVLTAYLLGAWVGTPIVGRLGDMHGKERVLVIVLGILAFGTLISAVATSIGLLLLGRLIQASVAAFSRLALGSSATSFRPGRWPAASVSCLR